MKVKFNFSKTQTQKVVKSAKVSNLEGSYFLKWKSTPWGITYVFTWIRSCLHNRWDLYLKSTPTPWAITYVFRWIRSCLHNWHRGVFCPKNTSYDVHLFLIWAIFETFVTTVAITQIGKSFHDWKMKLKLSQKSQMKTFLKVEVIRSTPRFPKTSLPIARKLLSGSGEIKQKKIFSWRFVWFYWKTREWWRTSRKTGNRYNLSSRSNYSPRSVNWS